MATDDPRRKSILLLEAEMQAGLGKIAADDLEAAIASGDNGHIWLAVYSLLSAAARLSRILWPRDSAFGKELRTQLSVQDDSSLGSRHLRNFLEHFGEKVDEWAKASRGSAIHDQIVVRGTGSVNAKDVFRQLNLSTLVFTYLGHRYKLQPLIGETRRIEGLAWPQGHISLTTTFGPVVGR